MFRGLINDAKSAISDVVARSATRVAIAVPFLVALGFATAAITLHLIDRFGAVNAYWMLAVGFAVVGLLAALTVGVRMSDDAPVEAPPAGLNLSDAAASTATQLPIAALGALISGPLGPAASLRIVRMLARNLPLVVFMALIAMLFWPVDKASDADAGSSRAEPPPMPAS